MKTWQKNTPLTAPSLFIIFLLLILPFVYSTRVPDPSLTPRMFALTLLLLVYVLVVMIRKGNMGLRYGTGVLIQPLFMAYGFYLLFGGISVFFAINTWEGIHEWVKTIVIFLCFILMVDALESGKVKRGFIVKIIVLVAILQSARGFYELISVSAGSAFDHQASYFIRAYSSNRNLFSQFLFLCLPFTAYGIVGLSRSWRLASWLGTLMIATLTIMLLTRSVWVAFLISFMVTFLLFLIHGSRQMKSPGHLKKLAMFIALFAAVLGVSLVLYSQFGDLKVFREQLYWIGNYKFGSSLERVELWQKSLRMGLDHMLTGVGAGNWRIWFPAYGMLTGRPDAATTFFQRPHNDFLWVLAENGIFALLSYVVIFILAFLTLLRSLKDTQSMQDRYFTLSIFFGLTGYLVIAMMSFPRERIEHQVILHLYLAFGVVSATANQKRKAMINKLPTTAGWSLMILILLSGTLLSGFRLNSERHALKAYHNRDQQRHRLTINEIDKAENFCSTLDTYSTPLSWYRGEAEFLLGYREKAFRDFKRAYTRHPNHVYVLNNLATSYELVGNHERARQLYLKAVGILPGFQDALLNLAAVYSNAGAHDSALVMLSKIPPTAGDQRYLGFRSAILKNKLAAMIESSDDRIIRKSVERIRNDEQWTLKVYQQAIRSQADFESEVYREVIYLLESVDSTLSGEQARDLKKKYNL